MPKSELVPYGAGRDADVQTPTIAPMRLPIRLGRWRCVGGERGGFVVERTNARRALLLFVVNADSASLSRSTRANVEAR
jgi:hypothetical protein